MKKEVKIELTRKELEELIGGLDDEDLETEEADETDDAEAEALKKFEKSLSKIIGGYEFTERILKEFKEFDGGNRFAIICRLVTEAAEMNSESPTDYAIKILTSQRDYEKFVGKVKARRSHEKEVLQAERA